jgi:hypothetical protein
MSNLTQFKSSGIKTLTSSTQTRPTSDSDSVQTIDPSLSDIFNLAPAPGSYDGRVYFKLLDGTYEGQTVTLLRKRPNGAGAWDGATGDSGLTVDFKSINYSNSPYGYVWTFDPNSSITAGGPSTGPSIHIWNGDFWNRNA